MRFLEAFDDELEDGLPSGANINNILIIMTAIAMMILGLIMRQNTLNSTLEFRDEINGIQGQLPLDWLLDQTSNEYIFRAEDSGGLPLKR